jgi:uncharacterized protein YlxP (DUF503 family)
MKYKFPQFKAEITDPQIAVQSVTDNLKEKTCSVDILLTTETAKFGVNLSGFTYSDTWEDADIYAWVQVELEKFAV